MRAWQLRTFGLENLELAETPTPEPGPDELLVKVGAVALNFRDKAIVDGIYEPDKMPENLIPVADAAGTVVAVGEGVTAFAVGDRVTSHFYSRWLEGQPSHNEPDYSLGGPLHGGLAEYMVLHEDTAVPAPDTLSDEQAATLPIAALTAWYSLVENGKVQDGQTVLIQGTGGVSIFGVQFAAALGARVIATSSSDEKLERVRELGATDLINYRTHPDWEKVVLELTDGLGVDVTLDVVGGAGLNRSIAATRPGGHVNVIGFLDGQTASVDLMTLLFRQTKIHGIAVGHRASFVEMNNFIDEHKILPVIDTVYEFEDAIAAYEHLNRGAFGKIVVRVG
ncbi:alcohol dehydrogenase [Pseudonocardia sulfidoxydans NBRC 16205]|uniref:Alcohol dehydrogenase n=1 Tax=Pseudonocardia sulfidoxydans NBRC 16205 TaxID=1223511 RepID=A0A511DH83_9PSEU|nr:NAD(P)-dependent alcohol dehydrogenase [Pseudonocardia sulfidoxydans]GEL23733.1 alcohol dehydrogenase [Pseudonocardia sulfidoxydans NBRC 16205]